MASVNGENSPAVCAVCLHELSNPRLLPCLHTFCCACIDQHAVTTSCFSKARQEFRCPLCRSACSLPQSGAAGLPRDVTSPSSLACKVCDDEGSSGDSVSTWCSQCEQELCSAHTLSHVLTNPGHSVRSLLQVGTERGSRAYERPPSSPVCAEHDQPLTLFCRYMFCNEPVCGHCVAIGKHKTTGKGSVHGPVVPLKDVLRERQKNISGKIKTFQEELLPRAQRSIADIDKKSAQLLVGAEEIRSEIHAAAEKVVKEVNQYVQELLQKVDDREQACLKELDKIRDDLKGAAHGMESVCKFSEKVMKEEDIPLETWAVLFALEKRALDLSKFKLTVSSTRSICSFSTREEQKRQEKVREAVGYVRIWSSYAKLI